MAELKFEITEQLGILATNAKGWNKELNLVSWNEREPKYDIREIFSMTLTLIHLNNNKGLKFVVNKLQAFLNATDCFFVNMSNNYHIHQ